MRRILLCLLSFAALAAPTTSWEASISSNLGIAVTASQAIAAVNLSNSSFVGGSPAGTVVGAISVAMSPAAPAFSGTLSLSGTNASSFQIVGASLRTTSVVAAGAYRINLVATQAGATGSPFTQAETITGTSPPPPPPVASACPDDDGSKQASPGAPQLPSLLNGYVKTAHELGCLVAGVDYHVGLSTSQALRDPASGGLPAGCAYGGSAVVCNNANNITIQGFDFSLRGGIQLRFSGTKSGTINVTNNNFAMCDALLLDQSRGSGKITVTYNNFDGQSCASSQTYGFIVEGDTVKWNYIHNSNSDMIWNASVIQYNLLYMMGYGARNGAHPDGVQYCGFTGSPVITHNTYFSNNSVPSTGGNQPLHIEAQCGAGSRITNAVVAYNTVITPGTGWQTGNYDIACKSDDAVGQNDGFKAYGNYVDPSGATAPLLRGEWCTNTTWGSPNANINMITGRSVSPVIGAQ